MKIEVQFEESEPAAPLKTGRKRKLPRKQLAAPKLPKVRVPKAVRTALLSMVILTILLLGAGAAYTWYAGQSAPVKPLTTAVAAVSQPSDAPIKPHTPSPNAKESAAIEMLSSPVAPGQNAVVSVKTQPTSSCTISVVYGTTTSKDSGLGTKIADDFGTVSWSWTVDPTAAIGTWPVSIVCAYNGRTAVVQGDLTVARS